MKLLIDILTPENVGEMTKVATLYEIQGIQFFLFRKGKATFALSLDCFFCLKELKTECKAIFHLETKESVISRKRKRVIEELETLDQEFERNEKKKIKLKHERRAFSDKLEFIIRKRMDVTGPIKSICSHFFFHFPYKPLF